VRRRKGDSPLLKTESQVKGAVPRRQWWKRGLSPFLALAAGAVVLAQTPAQPVSRWQASGAPQRLDQFVAQRMRQDRTPGLALAITSRDSTLAISTYGFADLRARVPLTPDHLFEIGSVSKSFTALALLQQRDAGRFDPQAPIAKYLPWFSIKSRFGPIAGHHLLTHTAGIPRDRDDIPSSLFQAAALRDRETGSAPGARYAYSNIGYQVLGYALAEIAGRPYSEVVRDRILRALNMTASEAQFTHETRLRMAVGYESLYDDRPSHSSHPVVPATWLEYAAGDGSIASTPGDMAAYVRMLLNRGRGPNGQLISEDSFALFTQRAIATGERQWYGYGITVREVDGRTVLSHSGGMVGYASSLAADLTDGLGVFVMVNGPGAAGAAADFALRLARAAQSGTPLPEMPAAEDAFDIPAADSYAGTYAAPDGRRLTLAPDRNRLFLDHRAMRIPLERRGRDAFYVNHPDFALFLLRFARDAEKLPAEVSYGGDWFVNARYQGPRTFAPPEQWKAFPGHYRTQHQWFNNFRIVLRKDELWLVSPGGGEEKLFAVDGGAFAVGDKESAERIRFDTIVNGEALRADLAGVAFYRTFTP
jgi:D-alanyl-D-alanine carboxypeptidase